MSKLADLIFVCAVIGLVSFIAISRSAAPVEPPARAILTPGESYDGMTVTPGRRSVLLVISPACRFCVESMGFYRRLLVSASQRDVDVVFHSSTPDDQTREFLSRYDIPAARLSKVRLPNVISGTPATVVLDSAGRVVVAWIGKLNGPQEREVLALLD
jgi:hypothetical protein